CYLARSTRSTRAAAARKYLLRPRSPTVLMLKACFNSSASPALTPASASTGALTSSVRPVFSNALSIILSGSALIGMLPPPDETPGMMSRRFHDPTMATVDLRRMWRGGGKVRPIRLLDDPILRTPCEPVTSFDRELAALIADMVATMDAA